jgi:hypothetical protein
MYLETRCVLQVIVNEKDKVEDKSRAREGDCSIGGGGGSDTVVGQEGRSYAKLASASLISWTRWDLRHDSGQLAGPNVNQLR